MKTYKPLSILVVAALGLSSAACAKTAQPETFCRFVPERQDDFAWENDLIAFRAYGPAARAKKENNGFDCWLKRVDYPIVNKWYKQALAKTNKKTYHKDWGEGHDPYHVGQTTGCGGTGIWLNGARQGLETFTKYEVIDVTPARSQFKLFYENEIAGDVYTEVKTITIELGQRLFNVDSVFTKNGKVAANLPVCIGVSTHDGKAAAFSNQKKGWIGCWEKIQGNELGTAARMCPTCIDDVKEVKSEKRDLSHIFIITKTDAQGALKYQTGYGWAKAGEITTRALWEDYLNNL